MKVTIKKWRQRRSWRLTIMSFLRGGKRAVKKLEGCKPGDIEKAEDLFCVNSSLRFNSGSSELDWELFNGENCVLPALEGLIIFKYGELNAATCNFSQDRVLGRGAHSCVYRGRLKFGKLIAVKSLNMNNKEACKIFCRELHIASSMKNRHVVPLLGFCIDSRGLFLVYKFISGGDLQYHLYDKENSLSWSARLRVAIGIAKAVHYMHHGTKTCVVHRDIKPSNVLLSSRKTAKLCDFGLATQTLGPSVPFFCNTVSGTFGYLAPEYFEFGKVSEKTDIYAFGVVLLELLTGQKITFSARSFLSVEMPKERLIDLPLKSCDKAKKKKKNHKEVERLMRAAAVCLHPMESRRLCMGQILRILQGQEDSKLLQHAQLAMLNFDAEYVRRKEKETLMDHLKLAVVGTNQDGDSKMPDKGDDKVPKCNFSH